MMLSNVSQNKRLLKLSSHLGEDSLILTSFTGTESISKPFHFHLDFFSANTNIQAEDLIGKPLSFQLSLPNNKIRYFHGVVKQFSPKTFQLREGRNYSAEVVPWLSFLDYSKDCCIYQNKSVKEIIKDVFKKLNFSDYSLADVKGANEPRLFCVQYNETALDFVTRLMEEEGIFYFFLFEKNKHQLVLADSAAVYADAIQEEVVFSSGSLESSNISNWTPTYQYRTGIFSESFFDFEKPLNILQSQSKSSLALPNSHYENYEYAGAKEDRIVKKDTETKLLSQTSDSRYHLVSGTGSNIFFTAGAKFKFKALELPSENTSYVLVEVIHYANDTTHQAGIDAGQSYLNTFKCVLSDKVFSPESISAKPRILGMQTATVVGPQNEEIFTDKYGRVKIQFHWDRAGKNDDKSSCWVRVAQMISGKQWGSIFIPRIGQEVVVSFMDGDPDQPLIVGSVYNAEQMPPYSLPANATQSGIKMHSTKQGGKDDANELRFEDKKDAELIYLHAQKDFNCVVEHDDKLEVKNDQTIAVTKNRSIEVTEGNESINIKKGNRCLSIENGDDKNIIKNNYSITVESGNHTTKVSAGKSVHEAMQSIELKVGQNSVLIDQSGITIKGIKLSLSGTLVEIKADASLKLEGAISEVNATAMLKLQGGITMIN